MKDVYDYLKGLLKKDDVVVLGCSGGPDSMCLLDLLIKVRRVVPIKLVCAHVNHNVRKASFKEKIFMEDYCKKYNVLFEYMLIEKYGDDNFHNEARSIRYNFFNSLIDKYKASYLFTAHHGDDLMETILMRIVRGSTLNGYAGFSKVVNYSHYKLIRPLINHTKKEIENYDKKNKIPYVIDKSNFKTKYTRNRYRKYVLPFLKNEDKNVHEKFLKFSNELLMYDKYINEEVLKNYNMVYKDNVLNIAKFKTLDELIQNKIIYKILKDYYQDDLILINDCHVNLIKKIIYSNRASAYIYLPNNVKVVKSYNNVTFGLVTKEIDSYEIEISNFASLPNGNVIERIEESDCNSNYYCRLNESDIAMPLRVRTRQSGDKMIVKGMESPKKVKDIFINSKIPKDERDKWPIVVDSKDKIVWIPGIKKSKFDIPKSKKCDILLRYY